MKTMKRLCEKKNYINRYTVQFIGKSIKIGEKVLSLGQASTDMMNLNIEYLFKIKKALSELLNFFDKKLFCSDVDINEDITLAVMDQLNNIAGLISRLPVYENLNIEVFQNIDKRVPENAVNELKQILNPETYENKQFVEFILGCVRIPDDIMAFKESTVAITEIYFERLKKRDANSYAVGIYDFLKDECVQKILEDIFPAGFQLRQEQPVMIEYVTMPNPDKQEEYCIAERIEFDNIASFLHLDFYRSLINGRAPRRCHNCGKYFLLENGYNIKYCNGIAPGETKRTCRDVGAHNKEKGKREISPVEAEYKRAYERLKKRKALGKISVDEWNEKVAYIQGIKGRLAKEDVDEFQIISTLKNI